MDIKNTVTLITGAGSGLGAATARLLAEKGAKLCLIDIHIDKVAGIAKALPGSIALSCDVSSETSVQDIFLYLQQNNLIPRICINCAGILSGQRIIGREGPMSLGSFQKIINVNLLGTFNILKSSAHLMRFLPALTDDERGIIINTASIAAFEGQLGQAAYSASKAGVIGLTLPAAREFADYGIRVLCIAPGIMDTPMMSGVSEKLKMNLEAELQFPKRLGKAEEFAKLVVHIIENTLLNGSSIRLDGAVRLS